MSGHVDQGNEPAWYVVEGQHGQRLLEQGDVEQAAEVFRSILTRLGDASSFGRAVVLGRLGRCSHAIRQFDRAAQYARDAIAVIGTLPPSDGTKGLRGALRSALGDALREAGLYADARKAYEAALGIAEELNDLRAQGVDLGHLGALATAEGRLDEAVTRHETALRLFQRIGEPDLEAAAWHLLGRVQHMRGQRDEAERHYRESVRINSSRGRPAAVAQTNVQLAVLAQAGGRLIEARQLAADALAVAQRLQPAAAETWNVYGILADILDEQSRSAPAAERAALAQQARDYRDVQRHAPAIADAVRRLGESPGEGRVVMLRQLGRCFHMGSRHDLAIACYRDAIAIAATLEHSDRVQALNGALHAELGDMLDAIDEQSDARACHERALAIAERLRDLRAQARASERLGLVFDEQRRIAGEPFGVTHYTEVMTDYVFDTDLLIEGPRERRALESKPAPDAPADSALPMLTPCTRTWMDEAGGIHFGLPQGEPDVEPQPDCTVVRRTRSEVVVAGAPAVLWRLVSEMDGTHTVAEILARFPADQRPVATALSAALCATGVIDVSGRAMGRFIHMTTKKGVLAAGGLEGDAVLLLATDGDYRAYPAAPRIALDEPVPDRLRAFHALTRSRRSRRDYDGRAVSRRDFDALLNTACGVTGELAWAGRRVKLRAYPSSGALYAVEIYPVVLRVEGMEPAVYHYRAVDHLLEVVRPRLDPAAIANAALPVEREMVAGAAALFCMTGDFARHEQKYGQGGYRMLVAEAGHISMNLVLAATALGLSARPFGGVFDGVLNQQLGLDTTEEQFLLAVVVGHSDAS